MGERIRDGQALVLRELFIHAFLGSTLPALEAGAFASQVGAEMIDVHVRPGEAVYRQGELADDLYFIVTGEVRLVKDGIAVQTLGERSILAADALLGRTRSRAAIAVGEVHLLRIEAETWLNVLEDSFQAAQSGILKFSEVIQNIELPLLFNAAAHPIQELDAAALPGPLSLVARILALRGLPIFRRGHMQAITMLAELADEVRLGKGELLVPPAEPANALFVVLVGEVSLSGSHGRVAYFPATCVVGGTGALARVDGLDQARATVPSLLLRLRHEDYWDVVEEHVELVRAAIIGLAEWREALLSREVSTGH